MLAVRVAFTRYQKLKTGLDVAALIEGSAGNNAIRFGLAELLGLFVPKVQKILRVEHLIPPSAGSFSASRSSYVNLRTRAGRAILLSPRAMSAMPTVSATATTMSSTGRIMAGPMAMTRSRLIASTSAVAIVCLLWRVGPMLVCV